MTGSPWARNRAALAFNVSVAESPMVRAMWLKVMTSLL
jgi:hypothetical protein